MNYWRLMYAQDFLCRLEGVVDTLDKIAGVRFQMTNSLVLGNAYIGAEKVDSSENSGMHVLPEESQESKVSDVDVLLDDEIHQLMADFSILFEKHAVEFYDKIRNPDSKNQEVSYASMMIAAHLHLVFKDIKKKVSVLKSNLSFIEDSLRKQIKN